MMLGNSLQDFASPGVTGVLTSCGRHDLLVETLRSFYKFNTLPLDKMIVVEDGHSISGEVRELFSSYPVEWIETGGRVGQIAAIDYAYSRVSTPYIFHLEDDWEFFRPGFIEKSVAVLRAEPQCLQVRLRALDDEAPLLPYQFSSGSIEWRRVEYGFHGTWHGFSFNPGLRRLRDYVAIGGYGAHGRFDIKDPLKTEIKISDLYLKRGYFAAVLSDQQGSGYVRHIGGERHIGGTYERRRPTFPERALRKVVRLAKSRIGLASAG